MTSTQGETAPTRVERIKQRYNDCEISYETALGLLEALGMWESDADDYLMSPNKETNR